MTSQTTDLESFQQAIQDGQDAVAELLRTEVLYRAFEERRVEFYVNDRLDFEEATVRPDRFEDNIQFLVKQIPSGMLHGYEARVASQYTTRAPVRDPSRSLPKPIGSAQTTVAVVAFRCDAYVDEYGFRMDDPAVIVVAHDRISK